MLLRFLKWLIARLEPLPDDVYRPDERLIYAYFDGRTIIRADPLALWRRIAEIGPTLAIDIKVATSPLSKAPAAEANAINKIREIFAIKPKDGLDCTGTLSDDQVAELLDHFMTAQAALKKNSRSTPTPSKPATEPPGEATSPASSATGSTSATGSAANASSTGEPASSPSASQPGPETAARMLASIDTLQMERGRQP